MIMVKNLTKRFGAKSAVNDVSFAVNKGEILGFLGPNGAGKSTTMRMITGFIPPTDGTAIVGGYDVFKDPIPAREKIGYLPENAPVYPDMTVWSYLDFCARIRGFTGAQGKKRVLETIEKCFLKDVQYQTINTLSKGFKQRVCFAQSILHDPEYLIMDEPTDGLDPNQKHEVRQMIQDMSAQKVIILSTHILDEVDAICNRAIIIAKGHIVADETPEELKARSKSHGAVLVTLKPLQAEDLTSRFSAVEDVSSAEIVSSEAEHIQMRITPKDPRKPVADQVIGVLNETGAQIQSIFVEKGRLDEVFRTITVN